MNKKVVLITGGSSGIGKAIGIFLKAQGCIVYGTSRNPDKLSDFDSFNLVKLDVVDEKSIETAVEEILSKEGRLDVLINNAGVGITGAVEETSSIEALNAFDTNFFGPLNVMKVVLPVMRNQKNGLIINVTSIAGYMGLPYRGIYCATKGALAIMTEAVRMETKDFGVKVCTVAPGDYATNIAAGRFHAPILPFSPYKETYEQILEAIDDDVDKGGDPIEVAKLIYKIMNTAKPKVHYKVGAFTQKFSLVLKRVLPDKIYEKLLLNHYKL